MALELDAVQLHRLSLDEYHRIIDAGGFDEDARFELLDGLLVDMTPVSAEHEDANQWLLEWLVLNIDRSRFAVRAAGAITLVDEGSEPQPDFAVIARDAPRPYHPGTAALIVEVALSSLRKDLRPKARIYGAAGVPEYWVVDLEARCVCVHVEPDPRGGYRSRTAVGAGGHVVAQALTLPPLDVEQLLAAAFR